VKSSTFTKRFGLAVSALFLVIAGMNVVTPASANSSGVSVVPSIARIDLSEDKPEAFLQYKNNTNAPIELHLSAQDFREGAEEGKLQLLDKQESANYRYSLSSWISFENPVILLQPGESKKARLLIDAQRLSPGGHYATVNAEITQKEADKEIKVRGILSSMLFVRAATGQEIDELKIENLTKQNTIFFPEDFWIKLQNSGNVELSPNGMIEIIDPFGKTVSKGFLNQGSQIILPETIRTFKVENSKPASFLTPGNYQAKLTLHYGKENKELTHTITFLSLGSKTFIVTTGVVLALLLAGGFYLFLRSRKKS
jgi:hypothetical protein